MIGQSFGTPINELFYLLCGTSGITSSGDKNSNVQLGAHNQYKDENQTYIKQFPITTI